MQRRERGCGPESLQYRIVDQAMAAKLRPAMYEAMSDRGRRRQRTLGQKSAYADDRRALVGNSGGFANQRRALRIVGPEVAFTAVTQLRRAARKPL